MMKKEKKEGSMPKDSLLAELTSGSIKRKQRGISFQYHPRLKIIEYPAQLSHAKVKRKHIQEDIQHSTTIVT